MMPMKLVRILPLFVLLAACSNGNNTSDQADAVVTPPVDTPTYSVDPASIDVSEADYCDITQTDLCLLPYPNDYFMRDDPATPTGKRVNFDVMAMPTNQKGKAIDPTEFNRSDGFSIAGTLITRVEGIDLAVTGAASIVDMGASLDPEAPIQLLHAQTGERQMIWAELDQNPAPGEPQALIIHAAQALENGQRYIVALQNLRDADGERLTPEPAFRVYQEAIPSDIPALESRRAHFESLFASLEDTGIAREALYQAWDFTTMSTENTTARALHMRDTSLAALAGSSPVVIIDSVTNNTPAEDADIARIVEGTITVPNFLDSAAAGPGSRMNFASDDPDALPTQFNGNGTVDVPFLCAISQAAMDDAADGDTDTRAVVVGHGLLGDRSIATQTGEGAQIANAIFCSMDWWGMSEPDIGTVFSFLGDLSLFPTLPDRIQQALLNKIFLSEAIVNAGGFQTLAAFQDGSGNVLFKTGVVQYNGISMGSVYGGSLTALSPHFDYATLDLAGMNWSLLIQRSNVWSTFSIAFDPAYPSPLVQTLALSLIQGLWDRAESNGYANHISRDPLPGNTKLSRILINSPIGDQILTETAAEFMQRSLGVRRHNPSIVPGRHIAAEPYIGIEPITTYPYEGNAVMHWDSGPFPIDGHDGTPLQRLENLPRNLGYDTHSMPMREDNAWVQKATFWRTGQIINVCGATPCYGDGYDGTPGVYDPANAP